MLKKFTAAVAASTVAVSLLVANPVAADDAPSSVKDSGPNRASQHDASPTEKGARAKGGDRSSTQAKHRTPQAPSSASESGPNTPTQHPSPTQKGARDR